MKEGAALYAQQIDHGRSDIWHAARGEELTERRRLATNEVVNVTRRHCTPEVFNTFYADYHIAGGQIAVLAMPNLDEVVAELRLKPLE